MRVLMIAPPGAGKGTQGALIAAHFGIPPHTSRSGLRNLAKRAEKLGGELRLEPAAPGAPGTRLEWRVPSGA